MFIFCIVYAYMYHAFPIAMNCTEKNICVSFMYILCVVYSYILIKSLVQDCSISIANALVILQSCAKPSMYDAFQLPVILFAEKVQDCSISIANTLEILQSCTKPSMYDAFQLPVILSTEKIIFIFIDVYFMYLYTTCMKWYYLA